MGTTADKLTYLGQTKSDIRNAIISKGVGVPAETTFREYANKISLIPSTGGAYQYNRPADWLALPPVSETDNKAVALHAVWDHGDNYTAFSASGTDYTIDWGDGTIENVANGVTAYHVYNYADLAGTECSRGYRQAVVVITPQSGGTFTSINFNLRHNKTGLQNYVRGWLDIEMAGSNITGFAIGAVSSGLELLERFSFLGTNQITDFRSMVRNLPSLVTCENLFTGNGTLFNWMFFGNSQMEYVAPFDISNGTQMTSMFYNCSSIKSIPTMNTNNQTGAFDYMFYGCSALESVPEGLNTAQATSCYRLFYGCSSLKTMPMLDTANCADFREMFTGCTDLTEIPELNTSNGTNFIAMFQNCSSLQKIPPIDTSKGTVVYSIFSGCSSLLEIPALDFSSATNMNSQYGGNTALQKIGAINYSTGTTYNGFGNFHSLSRCQAFGFKVSINFGNGRLSRTALVEIFNGLADVTGTGATITISGNYGASELTTTDREIATNKGWTIAG